VDLPKTSETLEFSSELDEGSSVKKSLKGKGSGTADADADFDGNGYHDGYLLINCTVPHCTALLCEGSAVTEPCPTQILVITEPCLP
jgi:hypothetical protein